MFPVKEYGALTRKDSLRKDSFSYYKFMYRFLLLGGIHCNSGYTSKQLFNRSLFTHCYCAKKLKQMNWM